MFLPVYSVHKCVYPKKTLLSRHTVNMKQTNSETRANTIKVQPCVLRIPSFPFSGEQLTGIKCLCKQRPLYGEEGALSSQYIYSHIQYKGRMDAETSCFSLQTLILASSSSEISFFASFIFKAAHTTLFCLTRLLRTLGLLQELRYEV